jgi:DNA-binding NtrC family response regulator
MEEKKIKLLVVDDEVQFLDSITKRLELRGFEVTKATNGTEAIDLARKKKFDIALVDLKMPGLDGKQVLEILKSEHKYIEVIILTGHGSLDSDVECTKLCAFDYLPKPYELEDLILKLKEVYKARLEKKFRDDKEKMDKIFQIALGNSPIAILEELKKLDDEEK